nr:ribonuclease H-like domain-containing protein [Tanacetum cinerariifolium]
MLSRYKACLVANDSTQLERVDVDETFSPVVKPVTRDYSGLFLSQKKYALEILDKAHMANCNPSRTPIDTESKLESDGDLISDPTLYRSLAGLIMPVINQTYYKEASHVILLIDIPRKTIKNKRKRAAPSSSSSSSSSNDDEEPSFSKFYEELSNDEDLTDAQREKKGMFKCLNRYLVKITKILTSRNVG